MKRIKIDPGRKTLPGQLRGEYTARINRVMDHITQNLHRELDLKTLAAVAGFSAFHFHRVFRAMTGETLFQFIQRLRLEKAAGLLRLKSGPSITDIAFDCGFSGSAPFARAFRESFKMSASQWRAAADSKIGNIQSKTGKGRRNQRQDCAVTLHYNAGSKLYWRLRMSKNKKTVHVEVKELPEMHVAYVRHTGPYKNDGELFRRLFTRIMQWAGSRNLLRFPETKVIAIYHDDPAITDEVKQRVSCCVSVPADTKADGEIGRMTIPRGKYALARFELAVGEYEEAWSAVFKGWLPASGWQCDDRPCFELYHNNCDEHPQKKSIVDICVPVRPL